MAAEDNLPDWLRQLRDQQMGGTSEQPAEPEPEPAEPVEPAPPAEPGAPEAQQKSGDDVYGDLRQKASFESPVEQRPQVKIPIVSQLEPVQRFVLALMLFLNVSVLGCLFLMVAGKISFVR